MKMLIISILTAASLITVASAADGRYPSSTIQGPTCVYMTTGL